MTYPRAAVAAAALAVALSAPTASAQSPGLRVSPPDPDPRVGLAPGMFDAGEAIWNLRLVSTTPPEEPFVGKTNSDLAFTGKYAIQGNFDGIQVWDISDPANPTSVVTYVCPASQSDVSVHDNLLFVSGEGLSGRLDCGDERIEEAVSHHRLRGIRIFDISDIANPEYIANVQTCRGSHTHTVLKHPADDENVYIYVSGSSMVRPAEELAGCSGGMPGEDPNTALFRIEVIKVPLDDPASAHIVTSPRIFHDLVRAPTHGPSAADIEEMEAARAAGGFVLEVMGEVVALPDMYSNMMLDSIVAERGGEGPPTAEDSATLRAQLLEMAAEIEAEAQGAGAADAEDGPAPGPTQCHDITVYPAIGLAGGACGGYGLLLDITYPDHPIRIAAVADSNFSYWHSATFNNDGTAVMFTDEWGGGGAPKCRASDPMEWGANAIYTIEDGEMVFRSYYKMPAPQTSLEICVAHNGSLIPVPGRDIMIQGWYQGGISLIDWTDPDNPVEIGFHDRGPVNAEERGRAGSWSVYWYNGVIVNSEIARGLDIFELVPSEAITQNEIDAANSVVLTQLNSQGQPIFEWPATFALARAYLDQVERWQGMSAQQIADARAALADAEGAEGSSREDVLRALAATLADQAAAASDQVRAARVADAVSRLADAEQEAHLDRLEALFQDRAAEALLGYHEADARFMSGMIGHHAQALVMSGFAPDNGASDRIQVLCARIINAQQDEIDYMQGWLRDRGETVPEISIQDGALEIHGGLAHAHHMPGMLTSDQLAELGRARGAEFDRLFLEYMIMHHKGAVAMVGELFATDGAAQDDYVFKLASDIQADQASEIARMELMLEEMTAS